MKRSFFCVILVFLLKQANAQSMDWVSLPQELNFAVLDMVVYQGKLIACGRFTASGSTPLKSIAAWDGSQWTNLGRGLRFTSAPSDNGYADKMLVFNNELYVVGQFDSAGTVASKNVAKWNGTSWLSLNATGFMNAAVNTIALFNNEVYMGGQFTGIGNIPASGIAKYNGSSWQGLGIGVNGSGNTVTDLCVYNNGLYASGRFWGAGNVTAIDIAMWDGSTWHALPTGTGMNDIGTAMIEWNTKLLVANFGNSATNSSEVHEWDGVNCSIFSQQNMDFVRKFYVFNNRLYCTCGHYLGPAGDSWVYVWDANLQTWNKVGTGVNGDVPALCEYNGELYCGGSFLTSNNSYHYMAKLSYITGLTKNTFEDGTIKYFPNPVADKLNLEYTGIDTEKLKLSLSNTLGQNVINSKSQILNSNSEIDVSFLKSGIYYLKVENEKSSRVFKVVKE